MRKSVLITLVLFGLWPRAGFAQGEPADGIVLPGSFWIAAGNPGPSEPGNAIVQSAFQQGIVLWQKDAWFLVPYVGLSVGDDTAGYEWNDKHPATVAVKLSKRVPGGVVEAGGGVMFERDPETGATRHLTAFASYWAGWVGDGLHHRGGNMPSFPGHASASSGLLTGRDPDNWITSLDVQQGVRVYRWKGIAAVPFAAAGGSIDTKRRPWENKVRYEGGIKAVKPIVGGVIEAGVAERREHLLIPGVVNTGPVMFVNFWMGWNPMSF